MQPCPLPIDVGLLRQVVGVKSAREVDVFSGGNEPPELEAKPTEKPSFESLASAFLRLADVKMSSTQKIVLRMTAWLLRFHNLTVTGLADQVSRRSSLPYSTVKWNLRVLMDMGLLVGGDVAKRGLHASLTATGIMLVDHLEQREE
jgi:hypothetical protein